MTFFERDFWSPQSIRRDCNCASFSGGRLSWPAIVLIMMPRNVIRVAGPSVMCSASGISSLTHACCIMFKDPMHSSEFSDSIIVKLSK